MTEAGSRAAARIAVMDIVVVSESLVWWYRTSGQSSDVQMQPYFYFLFFISAILRGYKTETRVGFGFV
jgi:hypothetical protein